MVGGEGTRRERITCAVKESKKDGAVMRQGSAPRSVIIATGRGN